MSKHNAANVFIVLAVVIIVAGVAWFKAQRGRSPQSELEAAAAAPTETARSDGLPPIVAEPAAAVAAPPTTDPVAAQDVATIQAVEERLPGLVDLGADKCIPCKKMAPILKELRSEYAGRAMVNFIDVWKEPAAGREYGIRVIPTQVFYDRDGNEVWRHEGFLSKEAIIAKFKELGVK